MMAVIVTKFEFDGFTDLSGNFNIMIIIIIIMMNNEQLFILGTCYMRYIHIYTEAHSSHVTVESRIR